MGSSQSSPAPASNTVPGTPGTPSAKQRRFSGKTAKRKHLFGFGRRTSQASEEFFNVAEQQQTPFTADQINDGEH